MGHRRWRITDGAQELGKGVITVDWSRAHHLVERHTIAFLETGIGASKLLCVCKKLVCHSTRGLLYLGIGHDNGQLRSRLGSPSRDDDGHLFQLLKEIIATLADGIGAGFPEGTLLGSSLVASFVKAVEDGICILQESSVLFLEPRRIVDVAYELLSKLASATHLTISNLPSLTILSSFSGYIAARTPARTVP